MTSQENEAIIRRVTVDRTRTPQQAISATGRKQCVTDSVVAEMPKGEGDEAEVHFFTLNRDVNPVELELELEYEKRGLKPADPYSLAAVNEADPAFADVRPNGTHWKDKQGYWCSAAFDRWEDERNVCVCRGGGWSYDWWFAGVSA